MKRNVAIISVGYNGRFVSKRPDINIPELIQPAVDNAISKTRLKPEQIEAYVVGNMHTFEGVNMPHLWASDHFGGSKKPVMRIATGGTTGASVFQAAYYHVASGLYDVVMAIGWEKHDEGDAQVGLMGILLPEAFSMFNFGPDMSSERGIAGLGGGGSTGGAAFQAMSYLTKANAGIEHIDRIAALMRSNAAKNPYAHLQQPGCTEADIAKTPIISYPLRYGHTCPTSCGAIAMILVSEEKAKKFGITDRVAWVKGLGSGTSDATTGNIIEGQITDPAEQYICKVVANKVYAMAGIKNPKKEIQVAEVYSGFSHQDLMWPERLGLVDEGKSPEMLDKGAFAIDGEIPINPSGGVTSTNAIGASAMVRVGEAALQVMGLAEGGHQVPGKVENALAHGWGGLFQFVTVTVLGRTPVKR
ncbi:MAG: thiolase C-terminal domain-containing protein [bacterium]